jgi:hypothetical protein
VWAGGSYVSGPCCLLHSTKEFHPSKFWTAMGCFWRFHIVFKVTIMCVAGEWRGQSMLCVLLSTKTLHENALP